MTRKDYIKIAKVLKDNKPGIAHWIEDTPTDVWENILVELANVLYDDNNNFNYNKFYEACNYRE